MRALILTLALAACASTSDTAPPDASAVIAAERAFAARAGEVAWIPAFREFTAPDGQMARPDGYINAPAELAATPDDGNRNLFWWPAFAAMSRSGDFGFTTGVVSFDEARTPRGHYFTVWRRQPDGSWKWIYDGGVGPIVDPGLIEPDAAVVPSAATATSGESSAEAAVAAVTALERAGDVAARLAPDALVLRSRASRAVGAAAAAAMRAPAADVAYRVSRVEASAGGDLVMVLGEASWTADGQPVNSLYARMWQHRAEGWRVLYDQLIIPRPAPAPG
jgi:ketosteroid isomerase-like protein